MKLIPLIRSATSTPVDHRDLRVQASKGDKFAKGDRIAGNFGTAKAGEWYVGTLTAVTPRVLKVKYDNGDEDEHPAAEGQTPDILKLSLQCPRTVRKLDNAGVKALLAKWPPAAAATKTAPATPVTKAPVAKKVVTPVATPKAVNTPKPAAESSDAKALAWIEREIDSARGKPMSIPITPELYTALPWLGCTINTGRVASTTSTSTFVGLAYFKNKLCIVSVAKSGTLLYGALNVYGAPNTHTVATDRANRLRRGRVTYEAFLKLRRDATHRQEEHSERKAESVNTSETNYRTYSEQFRDDYSLWLNGKGLMADIAWSNGSRWEYVQQIDHRNYKVGLNGGGSKLRWIGFDLVRGMKKADPDATIPGPASERPRFNRFGY